MLDHLCVMDRYLCITRYHATYQSTHRLHTVRVLTAPYLQRCGPHIRQQSRFLYTTCIIAIPWKGADGVAHSFNCPSRMAGLSLAYALVYFSVRSSTMAPIGVKFCVMVHIDPGIFFSFLAAVPQGIPKSGILGQNFGHLTANISKTVSRSVTCQLELNISSTRAFWKCKP